MDVKQSVNTAGSANRNFRNGTHAVVALNTLSPAGDGMVVEQYDATMSMDIGKYAREGGPSKDNVAAEAILDMGYTAETRDEGGRTRIYNYTQWGDMTPRQHGPGRCGSDVDRLLRCRSIAHYRKEVSLCTKVPRAPLQTPKERPYRSKASCLTVSPLPGNGRGSSDESRPLTAGRSGEKASNRDARIATTPLHSRQVTHTHRKEIRRDLTCMGVAIGGRATVCGGSHV